MFCILLGELQSHFKQLLLELFVEGNLASIHGAGYEPYCQVGVVRQRKIQEVKPGKAKILLLQLNLYECVICMMKKGYHTSYFDIFVFSQGNQ